MKLAIPFNIKILKADKALVDQFHYKKITELSIFDSNKETFHPQGLYSNEIFGPVGSPLREKQFAYIDIKLPVFHPVIFQALTSIQMHREIMQGSTYAIFDYKTNSFVKSDPIDGETGFSFFVKYFPLLKMSDSGTEGRNLSIKLIDTYRDRALTDKILVIPAGLRDIVFENNRPTSDEVNDFYKDLIRKSNNIPDHLIQIGEQYVDKTRYDIQLTFVNLYENLRERIDGKKKLFLGKWAARRIFNTSRNVITSSAPSGRYLKSKANIGFNDTMVGLYQAMKGLLPIATYHLKNSFLSEIFTHVNNEVSLINKDNLQLESVKIDTKIFDLFSSEEGLQDLISKYDHESIRHKPVSIAGHYLSLTYLGQDQGKKTVKLFRDIRKLPNHLSKEGVHPTTYTELFYSILAPVLNQYNNIITRYPISGPGSCQVTKTKVKTTINDEVRYPLNEDWMLTDLSEDHAYLSWPILNEKTQEAMSPPHSVLGAMGADFDGDTMSFNPIYSDEATEETNKLLNSKGAYVDSMGNFLRTTNIDTVKYVFFNMTSK